MPLEDEEYLEGSPMVLKQEDFEKVTMMSLRCTKLVCLILMESRKMSV